jgi:hypothetical protein
MGWVDSGGYLLSGEGGDDATSTGRPPPDETPGACRDRSERNLEAAMGRGRGAPGRGGGERVERAGALAGARDRRGHGVYEGGGHRDERWVGLRSGPSGREGKGRETAPGFGKAAGWSGGSAGGGGGRTDGTNKEKWGVLWGYGAFFALGRTRRELGWAVHGLKNRSKPVGFCRNRRNQFGPVLSVLINHPVNLNFFKKIVYRFWYRFIDNTDRFISFSGFQPLPTV